MTSNRIMESSTSPFTNFISPLREMLYDYQLIIEGYKREQGLMVAGLKSYFLPPEIMKANGLLVLNLLPDFLEEKNFNCSNLAVDDVAGSPYDLIILPAEMKDFILKEDDKFFLFDVPAGYGQEASIQLHREFNRLFEFLGKPSVELLDKNRLKEEATVYDTLRRLIRGISANRKLKPDILSNEDFSVIFNASLSLPPEKVLPYISNIHKKLSEISIDAKLEKIPMMIFSSFVMDQTLFDEIENEGVVFVEDDFCTGRRNFDLSVNIDSPMLYHEILDAFSYYSYCPMIRQVEERYELIYKMLKSFNIEAVVFFEDLSCSKRKEHFDFLRVKLMRQGVDPIIVNKENALQTIKDYVART